MRTRNRTAARLLLLGRRGGGPVNTNPGSHNGTSPVIGTQIVGTAGTWSGSPTLTYQWYKNLAASTVGGTAISGATSLNYTPADGDSVFGYYVYFAEIPNLDTGAQVFSNVSGQVLATPVKHWWSADGVLWQTSARATLATANGDLVGAVDDKIAGGVNALQSTAGLRVTLRIDGTNKYLWFSGTKGLTAAAIAAFPSKRGCIFISFNNLASAAQYGLLGNFGGSSPVFIAYSTLSGGTEFKWFDGTHRESAAYDLPNTPYVQQFWRDSNTTMKFYRDDTLADSLTVNDAQPAANNLQIGGIGNALALIARVKDIIVTSDISDDLRDAIGTYLLTRPAPVAPKMVGFGDSITFGTGASSENTRWLNLVNAGLTIDHQIINSGVSGTSLQNTVQNTVSSIGGAAANNGRDTVASRVTAYTPDRVFILYGLNDLRLNDVAFTAAAFETDLGEVVDAIVTAGTAADDIVIGSPPYISDYAAGSPYNGGDSTKHDAYRDACAAVALAKGTRYVDVYQYMIDNGGASLISGDGIHPNDAGHAAIKTAFLSVV